MIEIKNAFNSRKNLFVFFESEAAYATVWKRFTPQSKYIQLNTLTVCLGNSKLYNTFQKLLTRKRGCPKAFS